MDREELIKEHNEMVAKLLTEIKYLYLQRDNINNAFIEKFYNTTMNILNFYLKQPEWKVAYKENRWEIRVGDFLNGYKIQRISEDPFIKGQIDIFTNGEEMNWQGDRSQIIFRLIPQEEKI